MVRKIMIIIAAYFMTTSICFAGLTPLTPACIQKASAVYKVPLQVLLAVLATERGKVGDVNKNRNGTVDVGPMQINTVHFDDAKKWGLTPEILTKNGCANFIFATWYLSKLLAKHDVWEAIGIYHSRTPHIKARYQKRAWRRYSELNIRELLEEINSPVPGWKKHKKKKEKGPIYDPVSGKIIQYKYN